MEIINYFHQLDWLIMPILIQLRFLLLNETFEWWIIKTIQTIHRLATVSTLGKSSISSNSTIAKLEQIVVVQESMNIKDCFHLYYSPLDFSVSVYCPYSFSLYALVTHLHPSLTKYTFIAYPRNKEYKKTLARSYACNISKKKLWYY